MIVMLDLGPGLDAAAAEVGAPGEQLLTPLTSYRLLPGRRYAVDNGAFSGFNAETFLALLDRLKSARNLCRWVAVPDVVGSARRTLEVWHHWRDRLPLWPLAYVAQDGQENLEIPWDDCAALFIGGSTRWKMGDHATACIRAAQALGKWVHVGRVNTPGRWEHFERLGADSLDGSGLARYTWMREAIHNRETRRPLFMEAGDA